MSTYSDEYIEHHADEFVAMRLDRRGLTLDQYLDNPARYADLVLEPEPLLEAQAEIQARLDAEHGRPLVEREVEGLPCRNGALVEPLHHKRRHPKRNPRSANFARRVKA